MDKQSKPTSQLQQAKIKTEHTMQINHDPESHSISSTRTKKKYSSYDSSNYKLYKISTSNHTLDLHANYKSMKSDMQTKSTTPLRQRNYVPRKT
jgi:hypothetical protein